MYISIFPCRFLCFISVFICDTFLCVMFLSLYLISFNVSISLCSTFLCFYLSVFLSLYVYISQCFYLSMFISLNVSISLCFYLSMFISLNVSISLCFISNFLCSSFPRPFIFLLFSLSVCRSLPLPRQMPIVCAPNTLNTLEPAAKLYISI